MRPGNGEIRGVFLYLKVEITRFSLADVLYTDFRASFVCATKLA